MQRAVAPPSLGVTRVFRLMSKKERVSTRLLSASAWEFSLTRVDTAQVPRDALAAVLGAEVGVSVLAQYHTRGNTSVVADETTPAAASRAVVAISIAAGTAPSANALPNAVQERISDRV